MKGKKITVATLCAVSALSLASCKPKMGFNYGDYEFSNPNASVSVSDNGTYINYVGADYDQREDILVELEKYAIQNNISGITLFENASLTKYSPGVKAPITTGEGSKIKFSYVDGYGFGIVEEGTSSTGKYRMPEPSDPNTINYMNDKGSVVGTYHPYVASGYFGNRLERKNGKFTGKYEWYPALATEKNMVGGKVRPVPVVDGTPNTGADQLSELNSKYRIYVRTDIHYGIKTTKSTSKYNGQQVKLEDYETIWKAYLTQSNGLARSAENLTGAAAIKGSLEYFNNSKTGFNQEEWDKVGIKTGNDSTGGDYIEFEFVTPCTPFYAMYYLSSSLYSPLPQSFLDEIGGMKYYGSFNGDGSMTPVDTTLSTGPYVVDTWDKGNKFTFTQNTSTEKVVRGGDHRYQIPTIEVPIFTSMSTDTEAAWKEFEKGSIDVVAVPSTKVEEEQNNDYVQKGKGDSTFKLNLNTNTPEEWEALFGENGTVTRTPKSQYWECEPAMANDNFVKGFSFAIDRVEYAKSRGKNPSVEYFSDNYMMNPEEGISYNETDGHKALMKEIYGENVESNYGYDANKARTYFQEAAKELKTAGKYKDGDTINIEIAWMYQKDIQEYGEEIKAMVEKVFNEANTGLKLNITNMAVTEWSDVYYKKMMVGQFDMAMGGISGNTLNPINFMEVLKSDNSSGFTLNYGGSTDDPTKAITYDNRKFTFDALFQAADTGAIVENNGTVATAIDTDLVLNTRNESDGSRTVEFLYALANVDDMKNELTKIRFDYVDADTDQSVSLDLVKDQHYKIEGNKIIVTLPEDLVNKAQGTVSFALIVKQRVKGMDGEFIDREVTHSVTAVFPVWEQLHK